jgi:heavy metal sensor kinase
LAKSIRLRLQLWYGLVLVGVVSALSGLLYYQVRTSRLEEADRILVSDAQYLDVMLRRFPRRELEAFVDPPPEDPDSPPGPPDGPWPDGREPGPPPGPGGRERLLRELDLPGANSARRDDRASPASYFGIWRADGTLVKGVELSSEIDSPDPDSIPPFQPRIRAWGDFREAVMRGPRRTAILIGVSVRQILADLQALAWQLAGLSVIVLIVGLAGGWLLSARILKPVAAIAASASAISETNLSERIDARHLDRELVGLADVLNKAFARLEAAFERQSRFTADASHELRTPLAVIRSHAELALAHPLSAQESAQAFEVCLRAVDRMAALVEGLLTLARADAGKLEMRCEPVDLRRVTEETLGLLEPLARKKRLQVVTNLAPSCVTGDASRLGQVVSNLLANAFQYNMAGGTVRVDLTAPGGLVEFSVADTGSGILESDRGHIFERFYRADKARSRASGGHGLGLAICKSIVEAHGGSIGFESEPGRGSRFWFRLAAAASVQQSGLRNASG